MVNVIVIDRRESACHPSGPNSTDNLVPVDPWGIIGIQACNLLMKERMLFYCITREIRLGIVDNFTMKYMITMIILCLMLLNEQEKLMHR